MTQIVKIKDDLYTLKKDNTYLLSSYDPQREVKRFVLKENIKENEIYILFGSALGYLITELEAYGVNKDQIYVYFPDPVEEKFVKERLKINQFEEKTILKIFEEGLKSKKIPRLLSLESYKRAYSEEFKRFELAFISLFKIAVENIKVSKFFSKIWILNLIRNLLCGILNEWYFFSLKSCLDFPVLICASGPSLNHNIAEISRYKNRFVIFSVLSATKSLLENGIKPDAVFITDGGMINSLYKIDLPEDIPIFSSPYASSSFLTQLKNRIILMDLLKELKNPSFALENPSVTIDAGKFTKLITGHPKVFCGFDMAYSIRSGSHSYHNIIYEHSELLSNRVNTFESKIFSFLKRNDIIIAENKITNKQLSLMYDYSRGFFDNFYSLSSDTSLFVGKRIYSLEEVSTNLKEKDFSQFLRKNTKKVTEIKDEISKFILELGDGKIPQNIDLNPEARQTVIKKATQLARLLNTGVHQS